jgi:hypothetical protein
MQSVHSRERVSGRSGPVLKSRKCFIFAVASDWDNEECGSVRLISHRRYREPTFSPHLVREPPLCNPSAILVPCVSYGRIRVSADGEERENRSDHAQPAKGVECAQQRIGW